MDYPTLKITQIFLGNDHYRCLLTLDSKGIFAATTADFLYRRESHDAAEIHWYLEEYPQYPIEHQGNDRVTQARLRLKELGETLFKILFLANEESRVLWERAKQALNRLCVEISSTDSPSQEQIVGPPWELLRDPAGGEPLASLTRSFVRVVNPFSPATFPPGEGKLRVLCVIVHVEETDGVPFRPITRHILQRLSTAAQNRLDLEVLYPPTLKALTERLHQAKEQGRPFHVIHYDGQVVSVDPTQLPYRNLVGWLKSRLVSLIVRMMSKKRLGYQGYLLLEPTGRGISHRPVDGSALGKLMVETDTPWLLINSCHLHYVENPDSDSSNASYAHDPYYQIYGVSSLGQKVLENGANGVVALNYMIPIAASAQFVTNLYSALEAGCTLGEAVNRGRRHLYRQPQREVGLAALNLPDDWIAPIVYEASPQRLFPPSRRPALKLPKNAAPLPEHMQWKLPIRSSVGFLGRDETFALLLRAFRHHNTVLLHGPVGSGKTQAAAELMRWMMKAAHFVDHPDHLLIWSDLTHYRTVDRLLNDICEKLEPFAEQEGMPWPPPTEQRQRIRFIIRILIRSSDVLILWVWDHVESIANSSWNTEERKSVRFLMRVITRTNVQILLLSYCEEQTWLGQIPRRVRLLPLPIQEGLSLIRDISRKFGRELPDPTIWRPLLDFAEGNPSALTLLTEVVLQKELKTAKQIAAFINALLITKKISNGEFSEIIAPGYDYPLGIILAYQFTELGFTEQQQCLLGLLHLFRGFVDVDTLVWMGGYLDPKVHPTVFSDLAPEDWDPILDRAADAKMLIRLGEGYYNIDPLRSVIFSRLFTTKFDDEAKVIAESTYVMAMKDIGDYYHNEYICENSDALNILVNEEANLCQAWQLAREQEQWDIVISVARGLLALYHHAQRKDAWSGVVEKLTTDFVNHETDGPISDDPDREEYWGQITDYRVELASWFEDWPQAERLQQLRIDWDRRRAAGLLDRPPESLDDGAHTRIQNLALSILKLGHLLRKQEKADCLHPFQVALELNERVGNYRGTAIIAFQLGLAYQDLPNLRDLDKAKYWYQKALALLPPEDLELQTRIRHWLGIAEKKGNSPTVDEG
ncbi:hypothetical protein CCP3SC1_340021 [Gammaproteobacteria bacterium]